MKIDVVITGNLEENCYFITRNNKTLVVDPGDEAVKLINFIESNHFNMCGILITHNHFDHIGALDEIRNKYNLEIIDNENRKIINGFNYEIIDTKGHTNDSVSFYFKEKNLLFCGDFLFKESIGRCDFENSSEEDMLISLRKIIKYNRNLIIFPGHGEKTTLEHELKYNPFLREL